MKGQTMRGLTKISFLPLSHLARMTANDPSSFLRHPYNTFCTWDLINAINRVPGTPLPWSKAFNDNTATTTSRQIILCSSHVNSTLSSHLNLLTVWEALKSPLCTSQNAAKVSILFIFVFSGDVFDYAFFLFYLFLNSKGSYPFHLSRPRFNFTRSRKHLIFATKNHFTSELQQRWCSDHSQAPCWAPSVCPPPSWSLSILRQGYSEVHLLSPTSL